MGKRFVAVLFALTLVGCSQETPEVTAVEPANTSSSSTTAETTTSTTTTTTTTTSAEAEDQDELEQVALDYFETVANTTYTRDSGLAEAGSYADLYSFYLTEITKADTAGLADPAQIVDVTGDELTIRSSDPDGSYDVVYSDIEVSSAGVVNFAVDGVPLEERMARLVEPVSNAAGVDVSVALLYLSTGGSRVALVEIDNQSGSNWDHYYSASFVASDGTQDDSLEMFGADTIRNGARGLVFYVFDGDPAETSGDLYIDGFVDDFATDAGLVIPLS